jgi:hypothetical protein
MSVNLEPSSILASEASQLVLPYFLPGAQRRRLKLQETKLSTRTGATVSSNAVIALIFSHVPDAKLCLVKTRQTNGATYVRLNRPETSALDLRVLRRRVRSTSKRGCRFVS